MSAGTDALIQAFRLWVTDKVPASGANWPNKLEIIAAIQRLALDLSAGTAGFRPYATTATRDADTTAPAGTIGYVYNNNGSATDAANGFYQKVGSSWVVAAWFESLLQDYIGANLPYADRAPITVADYAERNAIPMDQRYGGIMVWVEGDQRWWTLSADNLGAIGSNAGWKVPSWMVPLQQGTIAERNNRIGTDPANPTHAGWPKAGMRFLQTDVFPNVLWELRLAGDRAGITADSPVLTSPAWVTVPQAADLIDLKISGFAVEALSSDANPMVRASWTIDGPEPTSQVLAWGSSRVALAGSIREYTSKDWAAIKDIAVSGNSLSDATDSPKYHTIMATRRGVTSRSTARYSRDVTQTYRAGIDQLYFTFAGKSLPAGGTAKAVASINGNSPIDTSQGYAFLNTGDAGLTTGNTMTGTLVDGGVTRHVTVSIPNGASAAYSVAQDDGLAAITFSGPVLFIPDIAKYFARSDNICGVGQNIFYSGVPNAYGDYTNPGVFVIVDKFAAAADGNRFLFLDILPDANWPADGTPNVIDGVTYTWQCFSAMEATNARNEARHPGARARSLPTSGFPNGRTLLKYLQDAANPTFPGNTEDIAAGLTPREFRSDSLHLNLAGQTVTAEFFEEAFQAQVLPAPVTADTVFTLTVSGVFENRGDFVTYQTILSDVATASVQPGGSAFDQTARSGVAAMERKVNTSDRFPDPSRLHSFQDKNKREVGHVRGDGRFSILQDALRIPGWRLTEVPRLEATPGIAFLSANGRLFGKLDPTVSIAQIAAQLSALNAQVSGINTRLTTAEGQIAAMDVKPRARPFLGMENIRRSRIKLRKRLRNTAAQLRIAWHMDSWGSAYNIHYALIYHLLRVFDGGNFTPVGLAGPGWIGAAFISSAVKVSVLTAGGAYTVTRTGTWTDNFGTDIYSPDNCSSSGSDTAATYTITSTSAANTAISAFTLLVAGSGSFDYSWDNTNWTTVALANANRQEVVLAGAPATGNWTLYVRRPSAPSFKIMGLLPETTVSGAVGHAINATGTLTQQRAATDATAFAANAALINPDIVFLGTPINDRNATRSVAQWKADISTIIDRWRAWDPSVDICIICPPEVGGTNVTTPAMSLYTAAALELVDAKKVAVIDFQPLCGSNVADYAFASARNSLLDNVNTHLNGAGSDGIMLYQDTLLRFLTAN